MPGTMLVAILFVAATLKHARNQIRRPLVLIVERLQRSPAGLFTQMSAVAVAVLAIFQLLKS